MPPSGASPAKFMTSCMAKHRSMPLEPAFLVAQLLHPLLCAPREPLAPRRYDPATYNDVAGNVRNARGYISVLIDDAARERAENSHRTLTTLVAGKIRDSGAIPKSNRYVDLSAVLNDSLYVRDEIHDKRQCARSDSTGYFAALRVP